MICTYRCAQMWYYNIGASHVPNHFQRFPLWEITWERKEYFQTFQSAT